jgi:hypothetical protein
MLEKIKSHLQNARTEIIDATKNISSFQANQQMNFLKRLISIVDGIDHALAAYNSSAFHGEIKNELKEWPLPPDSPGSKYQNTILFSGFQGKSESYKIMAQRLEPQTFQKLKISGYLKTFELPTSIPDIIEDIGQNYGGGKYILKIVDEAGRFVKTKTFEIAGIPKIPNKPADENKDDKDDKDDGPDPVKDFFTKPF